MVVRFGYCGASIVDSFCSACTAGIIGHLPKVESLVPSDPSSRWKSDPSSTWKPDPFLAGDGVH